MPSMDGKNAPDERRGSPAPRSSRRRLGLAVCLAAALGFTVTSLASAGRSSPEAGTSETEGNPLRPHPGGSIPLIKDAQTAFAVRFIKRPTRSEKRFMTRAYAEFRGYPPFHDRALRWGPPSDFYQDLYAIYNDDRGDGSPNRSTIERHPGWVLRDADGNPLFIPYACQAGSCPAYAADPGNRAWRRSFIRRARREVEKGYSGLYIDNVNLFLRVGDGTGSEVVPVDPRTGQPMTLRAWRGYVAGFVEQVERELPGLRITHNPIWYAPSGNRRVRDALKAADRIEIERGLSDPGLGSGTGRFSYETMLEHVEMLHRLGKRIISQPYGLDPARRRFELASVFLVLRRGDSIASDLGTEPGSYWPGWDVDLGRPRAERWEWGGLLRRDFEHGVALVNPPGSGSVTVNLNRPMTDLEGSTVTSVQLAAGSGSVLRGSPQSVDSVAALGSDG